MTSTMVHSARYGCPALASGAHESGPAILVGFLQIRARPATRTAGPGPRRSRRVNASRGRGRGSARSGRRSGAAGSGRCWGARTAPGRCPRCAEPWSKYAARVSIRVPRGPAPAAGRPPRRGGVGRGRRRRVPARGAGRRCAPGAARPASRRPRGAPTCAARAEQMGVAQVVASPGPTTTGPSPKQVDHARRRPSAASVTPPRTTTSRSPWVAHSASMSAAARRAAYVVEQVGWRCAGPALAPSTTATSPSRRPAQRARPGEHAPRRPRRGARRRRPGPRAGRPRRRGPRRPGRRPRRWRRRPRGRSAGRSRRARRAASCGADDVVDVALDDLDATAGPGRRSAAA